MSGNGVALQRVSDLSGPLGRKLEQPQSAVMQKRISLVLRRSPLGLAFDRIDARQNMDGCHRFTGKAATGLGQLVNQPLEVALEPLGGPLGAGDAALRVFDNRLDPLAKARADL